MKAESTKGDSSPPVQRPLNLGDVNMNPPDLSLPALLLEDFRTHGSTLLSPGFWALSIHRFGNWRMSVPWKPVRAPLTLAYKAAHQASILLWNLDLPYTAKIGRRLRIMNHGAVTLGARETGDDCTLRAPVTIGLKHRSERVAPTIGNRVEIGPGACVVGGIHVADDSWIAGNTVLATDVPAGSTVLGSPGRCVKLASHLDPPTGS